MSSPWRTIVVPETKDLQEIISEELKEKSRQKGSQLTCPPVELKYEMTDEELAKILQEEYNIISSEDDEVYSSEDCGASSNGDSDLEYVEDPLEKTYHEKFGPILEKFDSVPLYDCKNRHIKSSKKCKLRVFGVNAKAKLMLSALITKQVFDEIHSRIPTRKEGLVLLAKKYVKPPHISGTHDYIVKIFQLPPRSGKIQYSFIKRYYEPSYKTFDKLPTIKLLNEMTRREVIYLRRLGKAKIPCPKIIALKGHIIVLSLIGETKPALNLKESHLDDVKNLIAYEQIVDYMKTMYWQCNLIHTNLSEENILWHNECCYIISLSKALESHEEDAYKLLLDDCTKVCRYFTEVGVPKVVSPDELFIDITGCSYLNKVTFSELTPREKKYS